MKYIPGFGAVRSQQIFKTLERLRLEAAANFIAHYRTAQRFSRQWNDIRGPALIDVVKAARAKYVAARLAHEALLNLACAA